MGEKRRYTKDDAYFDLIRLLIGTVLTLVGSFGAVAVYVGLLEMFFLMTAVGVGICAKVAWTLKRASRED